MRCSESKIKEAIVHPEAEVRRVAVQYWSESVTDDTTIMPKVIEAVERYGRHESFSLLRCAERLPQTEETVQWLMTKLRKDYDLDDVHEDNYCCALALILLMADPELLISRHKEIVELPTVADEVSRRLDLRLKLHLSDWQGCWQAFIDLGQEAMGEGAIMHHHLVDFQLIADAMAAHRDEGGEVVLNMLRRQYKRDQRRLMEFIEPMLIIAAGKMRLEKPIPFLMKRLDSESLDVTDELPSALKNIGTDAVVQAINRKWWDAGTEQRLWLCEPLEDIHTDLAAERAYTFSQTEEDFDNELALAHCLLGHLDSRGIEVARQLVLDDEEDMEPDQWDLRHRLIAVATIMGEHFAEYDEWHDDALDSNYGWHEREPSRLSRNIRGDFSDL